MYTDLATKSALVTGAFRGLGRHFALTLARAGCGVALGGRRVDEGEKVKAEIEQAGGRAFVVLLDVTDSASVTQALDQIATSFAPIDILVNNAGVAQTKAALDLTEDDWTRVIDVDLSGAFRVAQAVSRQMRARDASGSIVNIASVLGLRVAPQLPAYAAAKAGLIQLTKALALELARYRIRVNALAPGYIETDLNRDYFATENGQALIRRVPQRRLGKPEFLDAPLLLLASDASEFMTGAVIPVDGGHLVSTL